MPPTASWSTVITDVAVRVQPLPVAVAVYVDVVVGLAYTVLKFVPVYTTVAPASVYNPEPAPFGVQTTGAFEKLK